MTDTVDSKKQLQAALDLVRSWTSRQSTAASLGVSYNKHLVYYLFRLPEAARYKTFFIKKRNGGIRRIETPSTGLKQVQKRLNLLLQRAYSPRAGANGFIAKRGIVTNAETHVRSRLIANIDLSDFFGSINFGRVRGLFMAKPFELDSSVGTLIAQICFHEGKLPQGAPTSPIISNFVCGRLDAQLKAFAKERGLRYSRYADDITFSTRRANFPGDVIVRSDDKAGPRLVASVELVRIISSNGFSINSTKTRLVGRSDRQDVTGLTVNRFVNVPRRYIRSVRGAIHAWSKYGYERAQSEFLSRYALNQSKADLCTTLMGRIQ